LYTIFEGRLLYHYATALCVRVVAYSDVPFTERADTPLCRCAPAYNFAQLQQTL